MAIGGPEGVEAREDLDQRRGCEPHPQQIARGETVGDHAHDRSPGFVPARIIRRKAIRSPTLMGMPRRVVRLFALSMFARLPLAAVGLLFIVRTRELTGSYAARS